MKQLLALLLVWVSFGAVGKEVLTDAVYESNIKTVLFYPYKGSNTAAARTLVPPVKALNDNAPLLLEFDDLSGDYTQYHVKIVHCNANWEVSAESELMYLDAYNDFIINTYDVSQNTKIPYYHYQFEVPRLKLSGNYVAVVYSDYALTKKVLQRRFMIYEPLTAVRAAVRQPQDPALWRTHQQLDLEVHYPNLSVRSARQEFKVMVRKNYQWPTEPRLLKPTSDNASNRMLYFRFFDNENVFEAGNEFRFFDIRSTYTRSMGVEKVLQGNTDEVLLWTQRPRNRTPFLEQRDYNGQFVIEGRERTNPSLTNDYIRVNFALEYTPEPDHQLYVVGAFNQWQLTPENELIFDKETSLWQWQTLLKQGIYDYQFVEVDAKGKASTTTLEGTFTDTENVYEIFVYYQPPTARAERLIGYQVVSSRQNN